MLTKNEWIAAINVYIRTHPAGDIPIDARYVDYSTQSVTDERDGTVHTFEGVDLSAALATAQAEADAAQALRDPIDNNATAIITRLDAIISGASEIETLMQSGPTSAQVVRSVENLANGLGTLATDVRKIVRYLSNQ